jgi:hypothetical protein
VKIGVILVLAASIAAPPAPIPDAVSVKPVATAIGGKLAWQNNTSDRHAADPGARAWLVQQDQVAGLAAGAGKVRFKKVEAKEGALADASFNFGPTAYRINER